MKIKTGDKVRVVSGQDKGKEGKVIQALPKFGLVVVEGVRATVRHLKARGKQAGQRVKYNGPIRVAKVVLLEDQSVKLESSKPTPQSSPKPAVKHT